MSDVRILVGDAVAQLRALPETSAQMCCTSPPYWGLRDYGVEGQLGLERTPDEYVAKLVAVFREVRRVLRDDGTLWLNMGDSYNGSGKGGNPGHSPHIKQRTNTGSLSVRGQRRVVTKPKDLIGIPWRRQHHDAIHAREWWKRGRRQQDRTRRAS